MKETFIDVRKELTGMINQFNKAIKRAYKQGYEDRKKQEKT